MRESFPLNDCKYHCTTNSI